MMTLDEAIEHCKEKSCGNNECALDHKQLAEWLKELKGLRANNCVKKIRNEIEYIRSSIDSMQEEPTSVWHDANTLPSDHKAVIVEHNEYSTSICRAEQMSRVKGAKWAYIDDLLKL